jgi:aldehyde dehydrogenase (NAD+)
MNLEAYLQRHDGEMYIDGAWVRALSGEQLAVTDPLTGEQWASVPEAAVDDVDIAVAAAKRAFKDPVWAGTTGADRARLLRVLGGLLAVNAEAIAHAQVRENGKAIREQLGQTQLMPELCYYYAGLAELPSGDIIPSPRAGAFTYTVREPIGVVAALTPWNSPLNLLLWKFGPAIAAGNTVVAKPSEVSPVSTLMFAELVHEAGFPAGVFSVVTGYGMPVGNALVEHPDVDKIAFTGATATGRAIAAAAGKRLARVSLELGGKSPNIVFEDADLDSASAGVVAGIFSASGQTCMAGSRLLVQRSIRDEFMESVLDRVKAIRIGNPMEESTDMGTVASEAQYEKVLGYIESGKADGATVAAGGHAIDVTDFPRGLFIAPTIFTDVTSDMRIAREEIFGPVLSVLTFDTEEEALEIANGTEFGLAAGVWTNDVRRSFRMVAGLRAGTVWVNNYRRTSYSLPFGGFGQSGIGRENGSDSLAEYTETKSVWFESGSGIKDPFNPRA